MAPKAMKAAAMKSGAKPMTKGALAEALATESGLKKSECGKLIGSLGGIAAKELKGAGKFTIPGVCMVKTRKKAATPAGKRGGALRKRGSGIAPRHGSRFVGNPPRR